MVLLADNTEQDPVNPSKEDSWIWMTYFTDGSKITSIIYITGFYKHRLPTINKKII